MMSRIRETRYIMMSRFSGCIDQSVPTQKLVKCTSMRKLVLTRTVQHRATRQASIDTDCAAPWKVTHSWRYVAGRAACGGPHLSVHKKLMNGTSMRQIVLTRTVQHRATRQASIDTDCAAPCKVTHSWRHVADRCWRCCLWRPTMWGWTAPLYPEAVVACPAE